MLARAQRIGAVIRELPVRWQDMPGSTFHPMRDGYRSFAALAAIRMTLSVERRPPILTPVMEVA
ncbi:hypothetical protein GCM10029964_084310 [Kibdelosporangium lantanae]